MEKGRADDLESGTAAATTEFNGTKEPVATYKSIPDDDIEHRANEDRKTVTMGKLNEDVGVEDGANEKMLNDESNIVVAKEPTEVKFISENGDAKIDMEMVTKTLSGMGKEELMKYANDPFWIRLRWFLFVTFWLLWVGMLVGAIAIIVMAPKCATPDPKKWWEESPIVQLEPRDVQARGAAGVGSLLDTLLGQHVKVISLSKFIDINGHTSDFRNVQPNAGSIADLDAIVKAAKEREQRVVLELDPNHSSIDHPWFQRSINREDPYTKYYVWADKKGTDATGKPVPPNNWLSVNGGSAWEYNDERKQFYLHQFNKTQPDLNFQNSAVVAEFGEILAHWLDLGVSGFRLGNTRYLTEDPDLRDESHVATAPNTEEYQYLAHAHTVDRPENGPILREWREIVANRTNGDGLFALRDNVGADILAVYNDERTLIDIPQSSQFLETANAGITAGALLAGVNRSLDMSGGWPSWDVNGDELSLKQRMPDKIADSIALMTLLLPGTPIFKLNDTLTAKDAFATIAKARYTQTFWYGGIERKVINGTVFAYSRLKSGNPGYLVAYQSGEESAYIDLSEFKTISSEVNVLAHSPNYVQSGETIRTKLSSNQVPMSPKSTLVLTFVPEKIEEEKAPKE